MDDEETEMKGFRNRAMERRGDIRVNPNLVAITGGGDEAEMGWLLVRVAVKWRHCDSFD